MYRVVAEPIPRVAPPRGIRIRHCTSEWFEAAGVAKNDAFRDHRGSQPTLEERWGQFTGSPQFRPDLSWLAVADDANGARIAGFALTSLNEEDWDLQGYNAGYVALVGAVREWRGRRLAPALLAHLIPGRTVSMNAWASSRPPAGSRSSRSADRFS